MSKTLLDLTNAFLALDGLLKTKFMTPDTRRKIEDALKALNKEAAKEMRARMSKDEEEKSDESTAA